MVGPLIGMTMARVRGWMADASASIPLVHAVIIGRHAWGVGCGSPTRCSDGWEQGHVALRVWVRRG